MSAAEKQTGQHFVVSHYSEADFKPTGLRAYLDLRDLGVAKATNGIAVAHVVRAAKPWTVDGVPGPHRHKADFQFFYVLKGSQTMDVEGHGVVTVRAGDSWLQPPEIKHAVTHYSDDLEVLCLSMPAKFETVDA